MANPSIQANKDPIDNFVFLEEVYWISVARWNIFVWNWNDNIFEVDGTAFLYTVKSQIVAALN